MTGVRIVRGWVPGLLGETAAWHARVHSESMGFGQPFESIVARQMADYLDRCDPARDLTLSAWEGGRFAGTVTVDGMALETEPGRARLRWFIVPQPGQGLGRRLLGEAVAFLDARRLGCWLTTVRGLEAAAHLYRDHGFAMTHEAEDRSWGALLHEQRWERPAAG